MERLTRFVVVVAVGVGTSLPTDDTVVRSARAIEGGVTTSVRPEIGKLWRQISAQSYGACTGVLVLPHFVLTAAHCIFFSDENPQQYFFGIESASGFLKYQVAEIFNFGPSRHWGTIVPTEELLNAVQRSPTGRGNNDVALLRLAASVPADVATPSGLETWYFDPGETVTVFGYGEGRCHGIVHGTGEGVKRYGTWTFQVNTWSKVNAQSFDPDTRLPLICAGDSGGPAVRGGPEEGGPVWGVASASSGGADTYGDVIAYRPLMEQIVTGTPEPPFRKERGNPNEWLQGYRWSQLFHPPLCFPFLRNC
jgi:Trypsin